MNPDLDALLAAIVADDVPRTRALLEVDPALASATTSPGISVILWALYQGKREVAAALAEGRSEFDVFEATVLGRHAQVQRLLVADPARAQAVAADGFPAIGLAVFFGQLRCAAALLAAGADANRVADNPMKVAPIHAACAQADETLACQLVHLLLAFGANPNVHQQAGWTPLQAAAHRNHGRLIALLRLGGADPTLRNEAGLSAVDLARKEGRNVALAALGG